QLKMADIIAKDISEYSLMIIRGKKDGIIEGSPAITSQKVLVGRIGEVFDNFSKIILISNENSSFDAKIGGNDVYGIVKGKGHSEAWIELILKEKEVKIGDAVLTSALGGIFPKNLLVGEISEVQKSDVDLYQKAKINIGADIKELKTVFVIKN
ncbi:MAG: rod shape-determining protein MreC, partial [Patescibacteria group bacterium]